MYNVMKNSCSESIDSGTIYEIVYNVIKNSCSESIDSGTIYEIVYNVMKNSCSESSAVIRGRGIAVVKVAA